MTAIMLRFYKRNKVIHFLLFLFCGAAIMVLFRNVSWISKLQSEKTKKSLYNPKTLDMLHSLIKDPRHFVEKESVQKYFSWPNPDHPTSIDDVTDPKESTYLFLYHDHVYTNIYKINNELRIRIIARNRRGEQKRFGGDYFRVLLTNRRKSQSLLANVVDHDDGTYTATVQLRFFGNFLLRVILIHPSEAVDLLRRVTSSKISPGLNFHGVFKDGDLREETDCNIWLPSMENVSSQELKQNYCDFTNYRHGEAWFCKKPKALGCSTINQYQVTRTNEAASLLDKSGLFKEGVNLRVQIGEEKQINVLKPSYHIDIPLQKPPSCSRDQAGPLPPRPGGYFSTTWKSLHCNATDFLLEKARISCLSNKTISFLGDSTIRQWYSYFVKPQVSSWMNRIGSFFTAENINAVEKVTVTNIWEPREAIDTKHNITLRFSAHGPPLQNGGSPYSQPYIADSIDAIVGGERHVVAITIGTHLLLYNPSIFVQRLNTIKHAIERLLQRSPKSLVIFKGFNVFNMDDFSCNQCCLSDWLSYRLDTIARNMFKDSKGVVFLDMWDLSASHYSIPNGLHTTSAVVNEEMSLFLSFVCPNIH